MIDIPRPLRSHNADTAIILGSGLGPLIDLMRIQYTVPYDQIEGLPQAAVPGHEGRLILGDINSFPVIAAQGRVHLYEGWSAKEVTALVTLLAEAGVKRIVLTNAAGIVNESFTPGNWMILDDHLNLTGTSVLLGQSNFHDMSAIYSQKAREEILKLAKTQGTTLHSGVYAGMVGPQYETPAEIRMLRHLGADAVGMSTVLEAMQAHVLGLEVIGFSCLTNWGAGMGDAKLNHEEVIDMAGKAGADLIRLLTAYLAP